MVTSKEEADAILDFTEAFQWVTKHKDMGADFPDKCEGDLDLLADERLDVAATLSDEDDDCWFLAYKLVQQLSLVSAAEVTDNEDSGAIVHESEELPNQKSSGGLSREVVKEVLFLLLEGSTDGDHD